MKAKELIDKIKDYPNFEICFVHSYPDATGMTYKWIKITEIVDIGYSSKLIAIGGEDEN